MKRILIIATLFATAAYGVTVNTNTPTTSTVAGMIASGTSASALTSSTADYAATSGTASYSMTSGTATTSGMAGYATTSGTALSISGTAADAINAKAPINSPGFIGTPTAPTPLVSDSSTQIATTAFVKTATPALTTGTTAGTVAAGNDARIIAGSTALQPNGSGASLTGITAIQVGAATTAQGALANSALQPTGSAMALVGSTRSYGQLAGAVFAPEEATMGVWGHSNLVTNRMDKIPYKTGAFGVRDLRLRYATWLLPNGVITPTVTLRAAVEYPAGTYYPIYFNGKRDITLEPGGDELSGAVGITIPANTQYFVRTYYIADGPVMGNCRCDGAGWMMTGLSGTGATVTPTIVSGSFTGFTLSTPGSGYPPNSDIQLTFGSAGSGTGAEVHAYSSPSGVIQPYFKIVTTGTGYSAGTTVSIPGNATGVSDYGGLPFDATLGGGPSPGVGFSGFGPIAVYGTPTDLAVHKAWGVIGDSIAYGFDDTPGGFRGWPYRVFASATSTAISCVSCSQVGDTFSNWTTDASRSHKITLLSSCSDVILALGTNDLSLGNSAATIEANATAVANELISRGVSRVYICTVPPKTNGSNVPASTESIRVAVNTWIRTTPAPFTGFFDTADTLETSRNSGVWKAGVFYTDGTHPLAAGYDLMVPAFSSVTP